MFPTKYAGLLVKSNDQKRINRDLNHWCDIARYRSGNW